MCITRVPSNAELTERTKSTAVTKESSNTKALHNKPPAHNSNMETFVSTLSSTTCLLTGATTAAVVTLFSLYFPFWLAPETASKTYFLAFYQYNIPELHHFDTTAWTYGTDYGLAVVMLYHSFRLFQQRTCATWPLCQRIWGLLVGYAISTTAGALAHQSYPERELRNTWHFRLLWTICVGSVTFASQPMGCIASELAKQLQPLSNVTLPRVPELLWRSLAMTFTAVCVLGWFSYQRPACDIFVAGITQFPTSFYMMAVLWQMKSCETFVAACNPLYLWMGILAFIANAPLLPVYPLLVHYTPMSLAQVNTFLHSWLLVTWSMQAISLRQVQKAIVALQQRPPKAVPVPAATTTKNKEQ